MSLQELIKIVPPPRSPVNSGTSAAWSEIEAHLGIVLPNDYREFVTSYGSGEFTGAYIEVYSPFSGNYEALVDLTIRLKNDSSVPVYDQDSGSSFAFFPELPGLYPWGRDDQG